MLSPRVHWIFLATQSKRFVFNMASKSENYSYEMFEDGNIITEKTFHLISSSRRSDRCIMISGVENAGRRRVELGRNIYEPRITPQDLEVLLSEPFCSIQEQY